MMKNLTCMVLSLLSLTVVSQGLTEEHSNDEYVIKYPENWRLVEEELGANFTILAPKSDEQDPFNENVSLVIQDISGVEIDLDTWVKLAEKQIKENVKESDIITSQRFEAGRLKSHKIIYTGEIEGFNLKLIRYYQLTEEKAYILTFTALEKDYEKFKFYGQQILNSFLLK